MSRIVWSAGPMSGTVRIPTIEVGAYIDALVSKYPSRILRLQVERA